MYESALYAGEPVIEDENHPALQVPAGMSKGAIPRDKALYPKGCSPHVKAAKLELIPRSEWPALIEQREKSKSRISDALLDAGIPSLNQNGTSNCWANGPVGCVQAVRCLRGLPYVPLSPAFIATTLGEYGGGWGLKAMEVLAQKGAPPTSLYGANANRKQITQEILDAAAEFKNLEWLDLPDTFDQMATAILGYNAPCALGYNWWGHEVFGCDIVCVNGKFGVRIRNSWGDSYGEKGFAVLMEGKGTPDDLECLFTTTASVRFAA